MKKYEVIEQDLGMFVIIDKNDARALVFSIVTDNPVRVSQIVEHKFATFGEGGEDACCFSPTGLCRVRPVTDQSLADAASKQCAVSVEKALNEYLGRWKKYYVPEDVKELAEIIKRRMA